MTRKIISYNVNGIRAALNKGFAEWIKKENPYVICIQETRVELSQIDTSIYEEMGYYHFWYSAQKKGYSGVALFTKERPDNVEYGMAKVKYDNEGRLIRADFGNVTILCVYIPSGTLGDVRQDFKMEFLGDFQIYVDKLKIKKPNLIISGDFNICHKPIDINHPDRHHKTSGFLPEERAWVDKFVESGFIDTFREFNKEPNNYSWWSYRAGSRAKNLGWRIDYHMISETLKPKLVNASILKDVIHSDHCPVLIEMDF